MTLYQIQDEPRIPYRDPGEPVENYLKRLVDALIDAQREASIQINNNASGIVDNYASLPAAGRATGRIYFLRTAGGGPPAGNFWGSNGTVWVLLG